MKPIPSTGNTVVIVSISGGGTRATALGLSVLESLNKIRMADGSRLAQHIDIISSVSGGSVAAAYFALEGPDGFTKLKKDFIDQDGMGAILSRGLNPVGLAKLSAPSMERIDLLVDYLDRSLFHDATFDTLRTKPNRPYLILNAADMVAETPFAFTQSNFDLLCSDLTKMKLSTAVAASAAFPVALSPVTLTNYSPCAAQGGVMPSYIDSDLKTEWTVNPARVKRGRVRQDYFLGSRAVPSTAFIHLLDGGISDNLGVSEPIDILTRRSPFPSFLSGFSSGHIENIVFIMINARSFSSSELGKKPDTPGILDMLSATIGSSIDNATIGASSRLRSVLTEKFADDARLLREAGDEVAANNLLRLKDHTNLVEIDFDAIEDPVCRARYHNIPTSWTLKSTQIDALMKAGDVLLRSSDQFRNALVTLRAQDPETLPDQQTACDAIAKAQEK